MKKLSRLLVVFLIAALMLPLAIACAETNDPETTTEAPAESVKPGESQVDETTLYAPSDIPEDLKFPGTTIKFLYWQDVERPEFFVEETNGESVNDAIYERNLKVQDQFQITLEFDGTPGNFKNQQAFVNTCVNSTQSGADAHDIFAGYSMTGATLMTKALAQDLTQYEIIEFEKPWWPETLISKATINDAIYFTSGDISTNFLYMMYGAFFNKDMFVDLYENTSTLYDLVHDQKWTRDKLIEYSTGVFNDNDGDSAASESDRFGFVTINIHFDSFFTGSDLYTVVPSEDGNLQLSGDLASEKCADLVAKVCSWLHDSGDCWIKNSETIFSQNRSLFTIDRVRLASRALKDVDFSFGILPIPKYSEDQDDYKTCMAFPFTTYVLSVASNSPEAAAATIELMAYQSYLLITPALFEESMKLRYADAGEDSLMYDIVRRNVIIDLGRLLTTQVSNYSYSIFRTAVNDNAAGNWSKSQTAGCKMFDKAIGNVNKAIEKLG
jgi:ABC-type glycerol-3-phosphate transport system substrate-binding protein